KISDIIKRGKAWKQEELISILNPIITGWSNYHQSVVSKDIFSNLDNRLWGMLWRWAKRRHPDKSKSWIADKYWHKTGLREWMFSKEGNILKSFSDTKIVRHPNLKMGMNPYLDKEYFDLRRYKIATRKKVNKSSSKMIIA
ncbi:MAG: group II intron reverse transcriptase/maturase, partial [Candidatus Methanoperedens sp.]|nr:group II intron reverse transcriptase/maturase [Candidatus Methanoperedens sp.]